MLSEKLGLTISKKVLNKTSTEKTSPTIKKLSKTSLNFMALSHIARDMNVIRQNIIKLVKIYGGKASEKEDMHFLKDDEREKKFKFLQEKFVKEKSSEEDNDKSSKGGLFKKLKKFALQQLKNLKQKFFKFLEKVKKLAKQLFKKIKEFAKNALKYIEMAFEKYLRPMLEKLKKKILKKAVKTAGATATRAAVRGIAAAAGPVGWIALIALILWDGLTDAWDTWQETGSFTEALISGISGLVDSLTFGLFDKETAKDVIHGTIDFVKDFPKMYKNFIKDMSDHIFTFVNDAIDKVIAMNPLKEKPLSEKEIQEILKQQKIAEESAKAEAERRKRVAENLAKAREIIRLKIEERDRLIQEVSILEQESTGAPSEETKKLQKKREELRTTERGLEDAIQREQKAKKENYAPTPPVPGKEPSRSTIGMGGKFSSKEDFVRTLYPYAEKASKLIGGKVLPIAILGQWAGESGSGTSLPASYNYAGIKAGGGFKKGDYVLTEERYTEKQIEHAKRAGESLERVLGPDDKLRKSGREVTVDQFYGKGSYQRALDEGKKWVQVRSYFAEFSGFDDFAEGFAKVINQPRYAKAREQTTSRGFGYEVAKAGYATASAEKYSEKVAAFEVNSKSIVSSIPSGGKLLDDSKQVSQSQREQLKPRDANVVDVSQTNNTKKYDSKTAYNKKSDSNELLVARSS